MQGLRRGVAFALLAVGVAVFAIRLQHAGPYAPPEQGNLLAALLALAIGAWLVVPALAKQRAAAAIGWIGLAASPVVFFFALYALLAEFEEVVVLKATDSEGRPADLRLWIVDRDDGAWVTMKGAKADEHSLDGARLELLREGVIHCVVATRHDERDAVNAIHQLRHGKYAVQRIATTVGIFGRTPSEEQVALQLQPCPGG